MEIGKNNRIEQTPIHNLNLPANPHGYWLFGSLDFQSGNMISSQSRYDHFDTAPYLSQHQHLGKRGELMGRTSKNIKLRIPEKPHKIKGFRSESYRVATTISSQPRYDHFDTAAYSVRCYQPNYYAITFCVLQGLFSHSGHILCV